MAARIKQDVESAVSRETYTEALEYLLSMKSETDAFFDHVIVNSDNIEVKKNRLSVCHMEFKVELETDWPGKSAK